MKVLFLGAPIQSPPSTLTPHQRFDALGKNTGNLLIGNSLFEELNFTDHAYGQRLSAEEVNDRFDVVVIGAANFIFRNFDFSHLSAYLEAVKLPCVMIGLGAQAPAVGQSVTDIPDGTKRLLAIVSERSAAIGVRGYFTASVVNDLGIKNVEAIGCPSLYRTCRPRLSVRRPVVGSEIKLSVNGSRNVIDHSAHREAARRVESQLLDLAIRNGYNYVLQNENPEMSVLWSDVLDGGDARLLDTLVRRFNLSISGKEFASCIKSKFRLFFDLESWDAYIKEFDASIGSRFHGNLIGLTNGVPAFIFTHDSRTAEMAGFMHIPHAEVQNVDNLDVREVFASADYEKFERRYETLYKLFASFLTRNGLKHRLMDKSNEMAGVVDCAQTSNRGIS